MISEQFPRVVVFGYSEVGYVCLEVLIRRGVNVVGVITHEDDPTETRWFRSVAELSRNCRIPVYMPHSLKDPVIETLFQEELKPDIIFSFYYRRMIPMRLLQPARLGAFNMHGSFLPKYRGKAPVNWAILNGEDHSGVTLHYMASRADVGDIVDQEMVPIGPSDKAIDVMGRISDAAGRVLARRVDDLLLGKAIGIPQNEREASYFGGRTKEDGRIEWTWPTHRIFNLIRAVTHPYPGAFTDFPEGRRLVIWWAKPVEDRGQPGECLSSEPLIFGTGDGALEITDYEWQGACYPK